MEMEKNCVDNNIGEGIMGQIRVVEISGGFEMV